MKGRLLATVALLAATAIWGSTFVVTKRSLADLSPAAFLTWRFGIAAGVLLLVRPRSVASLGRADRRHAVLLGAALAAGFLLQTIGLLHTLAGVSGFLTGAAVIFTPVAAATLFGERVGSTGWLAVGGAAIGMAVLAGGVTASSPVSALLTLGGAAFFAVHISGLSRWATRANAYGITALSVTVAAILCGAVALGRGEVAVPATREAWTAVAYLALAATCAGFAIQAWAQSALTAVAAAVVMTMEPVFAAVLATAVGERGLHWAGWVGGLVVVASMFLAELGPRKCCDALSPRVECC